MAKIEVTGAFDPIRRKCGVQVFCKAKPWRKGEFISPAQVKSNRGPRAASAEWGTAVLSGDRVVIGVAE